MTNFRTTGLRIAGALVLVGALAACGGDDDGGGTADTVPAGALEVDALDIRFQAEAFTATGPQVTIAYVGKGDQIHSLVIDDAEGERIGERLEVRRGDVEVATYDLAPGTYDMWCDIPGHRDAGMEAVLTVS